MRFHAKKQCTLYIHAHCIPDGNTEMVCIERLLEKLLHLLLLLYRGGSGECGGLRAPGGRAGRTGQGVWRTIGRE